MKKKLKNLPRFATESAERRFWQNHDSADYFDLSKFRRVRFSNLKPSTATISLRLPEGMLDDLKIMARKRDVPYQSLIKVMLDSKIREDVRQ